MKRIRTFAWLLGLLLCLWTTVGLAEGLSWENADYFPIDLDQATKENRLAFTEDYWGHTYKDRVANKWRYFSLTAPTDGTFYISINCTDSSLGFANYYISATNGEVLYDSDTNSSCILHFVARKDERFYFHTGTQRHGTYTFSVCFDGYHKASNQPETIQHATCKQDGERIYPCELCGQPAIVETIPKPAHTLGLWEAIQFSTCGQEGLDVQRCTVCGEVVNSMTYEKFDHGATETVMDPEANCMQTGLLVERCSECHEVFYSEELPIADHVPGKTNVLREATCTASGRAQQRCSVCNTLLSDEIQPALGHSFGEWEITQIATSYQDGIRSRTCSVCGHVETQAVTNVIIITD